MKVLYNLHMYGIKPTIEESRKFNKIQTILYDDGYIEPGPNGAEITAKGQAFMIKGGYTAQWNNEMLNYGISFVIGACSGVVGCLITLYSN